MVDVEEEKVKLVIISLLDNFYTIYENNIKEILLVEKITFVPSSSDYFLGVINVWG